MNRLTRLTALLLALMMIFSTFAAAETSYQVGDMTTEQWNSIVQNAKDILNKPVIDEGDSGKVITPPTETPTPSAPYDKTIEVPLGQNKDITTANLAVVKSDVAAQWQIAIKDDLWVNILGEDGNTLNVNAAMLQGTTMAVRQAADADKVTVFTVTEATAVQTFAVETRADSTGTTTEAASDVMTIEEANPDIEQWTVEIRYVFADSQNTAANSWTGKVAKNAALYTSAIVLPRVMGYYASTVTTSVDAGSYKFVGQKNSNNNFEDGTIQLEINSVTADLVLYVNYSPAPMDFKVTHVYQDVNGEFPEIPKDGSTVDGITVETKSGMVTGTAVGAVAKKTDGFTNLWYDETVKIAADGSTNIIVYYERDWYLMLFDCNGGYSTEPVYARYGAQLDHKEPERPGYSFEGWKLIESNGNAVTDAATIAHSALPSTMPAENLTYQAQWAETDLAKVSVVIWGENANDEDYAYQKTIEIYAKPGSTVSFTTANTVCGYTAHTHDEDCYDCGVPVHTHGPDCCTIEAHTHSEACCTIAVHTHGSNCYPNVGQAQSGRPNGAPNNAVDGQIFRRNNNSNRYIYINGIWYRYNGNQSSGTILTATCGNASGSHADHTCVYCDKTEHTHDGTDCVYCDLDEHTHTEECFSCTLTEHTHTSSCYITDPNMPSDLWELKTSDTVTVAADGSTVMNVYYDRVEKTLTFKNGNYTEYTLTKKWGADISEYWPIGKKGVSDTNSGRVYDQGERWDPSGSSTFEEVLVFLEIMPAESFTLTLSSGDDKDDYVMHYMVEALSPNEEGVTQHQGKYYKQAFLVAARYNYVTREEDFFDLEGFTQLTSNPTFGSNGRIDINNGGDVYFYYTRNSYTLSFNDGYSVVKTETVLYGDSWAQFEDYVPALPSQYEAGSRDFAGWYWNPQGTSDEIVLSEETMPAENVIIYAKWVLTKHNLTFYTDEADYTAENPVVYKSPYTLLHDEVFDEKFTGDDLAAIENPTNYKNPNLSFIGWFYVENGEEKAWTPKMAVKKDLHIYGKWGLTKPVSFMVYFKLKGFDTLVAETISGQTLVDADSGTQNIDLEAKTGYDLFTQYQTGVFPITTSHTLVVDVKNTNNTYTFEYVEKTAVPYLVRYLIEDANGSIEIAGKKYRELADSKVVADNRNAVVTEPYKMVPGYMPDEYQKRLIVTGEESNNWITEGNVQIHPDNVINFIYHVDTKNAFYAVEHYIQPVGGSDDRTTWTQVGVADSATGEIGLDVTATPRTIPGFTYHDVISESYYKDAGTATVTGNALTTKLTDGGVLFKLYYTRNQYPYVVRYLEVDTNNVVKDPESDMAYYQSTVTKDSPNLITKGNVEFELVSSATQSIVIQAEEIATLNVITFTYEQRVPITYIAMTKDANGTIAKNNIGGNVDLNDGDSNLQAETSELVRIKTGAALGATAVKNTNYKFVGWYDNAACSGNALSTNESYIPEKSDGTNVKATYYALFELDVAPLTIRKTVTGINKPTGDIFVIQIELKDATGKALSGSYPYGPATGKTGPSGTLTLTNGVSTIGNIKDGDEIIIQDIVIGTTFIVTEVSKPGYYMESVTNDTDSITNVAGAVVEIQNAYQAGNLVITKFVDPAAGAPDDTFTMNVELTLPETSGATLTLPTSYTVGGNTYGLDDGVVKLKNGQSATIAGLPNGTKYTVTEDNMTYYTGAVNPSGEQEIKNANQEVTVTNTYNTGTLAITKTVVGDAPADEFAITVVLTLPNGLKALPDSVKQEVSTGVTTGNVSVENGVVTQKFTGVQHNGKITIYGLPVGTKYAVEESGKPAYYKTTGEVATPAEITAGENTVTITNEYQSGNLQIKKAVTSNPAGVTLPTGDKFTIVVTLTKPEGSKVDWKSDVTYAIAGGATGADCAVNGNAITFTGILKDSVISITGLPAGTTYTITEAATYPSYYTKVGEVTTPVTIAASTTAEETITNTYQTCNLVVEKEVRSANEGTSAPDDEFKLKVTFGLPTDHGATAQLPTTYTKTDKSGNNSTVAFTATNGVVTISGVKAGDKFTFNNLPAGTTYKFEESTYPSYYTKAGEVTTPVTIAAGETATEKIINTYYAGSLTVKKNVTSNPTVAALPDEHFAIDVKIELPANSDTALTLASIQSLITKPGDVVITLENDVFHFTNVVNASEIHFGNLPYGTKYTITELTPPGYYEVENNNATATIGETNRTPEVTITNTYKTGTLKVTKVVNGDFAAPADQFKITVNLMLPNGLTALPASVQCETTAGTCSASESTVTYTVDSPGGTLSISGLPVGTTYTVAETTPPSYYTSDISFGDADKTITDASEMAKVTVTNTYNTGSLTVTKNVTSNPAVETLPRDTFTIDVELTLPADNNAKVDLSYIADSINLDDSKDATVAPTDKGFRITGAVDGTQIVFDGLPHGTKYTVTEINAPGYYEVTYDGSTTDTIDAPEKTTVAITNTYLTGSLEITKDVVGEGMPSGETFTVNVNLTLPNGSSGTALPLSLITAANIGIEGSGEREPTTGGFKFTGIADNSKITINGIPYGTTYSVTEETPAAYYTVGYTYVDSTEKKIGNETADKVTVTNTYNTGSLDVTKEVVGVTAPRGEDGKGTQKFSFTLKLTLNSQPVKATIKLNDSEIQVNDDNEYTFTLKDGETAHFTQLPANVQYTVTETDHPDYTTTQTGDTGVIVADTATETHTAEAKFTNTYKYGDLTVTKNVKNAGDQSFIFSVNGPGYNGYIVIKGAGTVTLADLEPGEYTVTEQTNWSYRFTADKTSTPVTVVAGEMVSADFINTEKTDKWLHDESVRTNVFSTTTNTTEGGEQ